MRPSGTARTKLLVLLAALCAAGGALEEKKGKGVSHRPAPPTSALAQPQPLLRTPSPQPRVPPLLTPKGGPDCRRNWTFRVWNGRDWGETVGRVTGLRAEGLLSSVGAAAVRSGALDCCQLCCLTFLRSVGVQSRNVVRDSAGRRAWRTCAQFYQEERRDPGSASGTGTSHSLELRDWS